MGLVLLNTKNDENEWVTLKANGNVNLKHYALVDETFDATDEASDVHRHFFKFPNLEVKKDEYVRVLTGKGKYRKSIISSKPAHIFYWGTNAHVWNDTGDTVYLLELKVVGRMDVPAK